MKKDKLKGKDKEKEKDKQNTENIILELDKRISALHDSTEEDSSAQIKELEEQKISLQKEMYSNLAPYEIVKVARHHLRPPVSDYIKMMVGKVLVTHQTGPEGKEVKRIYIQEAYDIEQ